MCSRSVPRRLDGGSAHFVRSEVYKGLVHLSTRDFSDPGGCIRFHRLVSPVATKEGEEPMRDMSSPSAVMYFSQVEALWAIVTSILKIYGTQFRSGDMGPALDTDVLQSARVIFRDRSVPQDEIVRRVQAMGGRLLYKQKGVERLDVIYPPAMACKSCCKQGQGGNTTGLWRPPNLSDGAMASSGGQRGCWWAQKARWRRHKRELSDPSRVSGLGMRWCNGGAGSSGPTRMAISTPQRPHPGNRRPGAQWQPTYGSSPDCSERKSIENPKPWSWPTYKHCTNGEH